MTRAAGVKFGRPKHEITPEFIEVYQEWKADKITARKAMQRIGMSNTTFYRRVAEYEA
ncbi:hypothetical protein D1872_200100 [compost metagenome]